ncbi:MAG: membrane integrity-associated transporter subunit PqiC [Rhodobacteraceae bacterium]|nr:membrane integrity-associated transporter subunit PqiC [Paracoccaceae bacterium]
MTKRPAIRPLGPLIPLAAVALIAAGCSGPAPLRYAVPPVPTSPERVRTAYASVLVQEVSLPRYAASEEIYRRDASGALSSSPAMLWADDPARAVTFDLARALADLTRVQIAAEPWPFADRAQATVQVRVADMLADDSGAFVMTGQYFVAPDEGGRNRSGQFTLSVPFPPEGGPQAIATARSQAVGQLAQLIARQGLR